MPLIKIIFAPAARRELKKLSRPGQIAIFKLADLLSSDLLPHGAEKNQGHPRFYRLKQGDFRLIYHPVQPDKAIILTVADRRDAYRNLGSLDDRLAAARGKPE